VIDKLEFLLALASERHFGRAADVCNVTQPTLSAGLKQLEETLGTLLVVRGSRFQGLTAEGERVLHWARRIVSDARILRQEIDALKRGQLVGQLRIAAIPTAMAMVASLTAPYHERHPAMRFLIRSSTSIEVLAALGNLDVDAGISYLDNEPIGRWRSIPLYREQYRLLIAADHPLSTRKQITWAEVGSVPLCLLTPDMQNRRIVDGLLRGAGIHDPAPGLESNSMISLFSHVRSGRWASVMPAILAETFGLDGPVRAVPIVEPAAVHTIGLIVPDREPMSPATAMLVDQALKIAPTLDQELATGR
jgi:DNA-binding transcriptional LysR family regulator